MARVHTTPVAGAPQPLAPTKDTGIPWKIIAAGSGRKGLSHVHEALVSDDKAAFYAVNDAKAAAAGLGRATNMDIAKSRNRLAAELKKGERADLDLIQKYLKTLCAQNKTRCGNTTPTALHLYMGFGEVDAADRGRAANTLREWSTAARHFDGSVGDNGCDEMLQWIRDAWTHHASLLDPDVPPTSTLASTPAGQESSTKTRARGPSVASSGATAPKQSQATQPAKSPRRRETASLRSGLRDAQEILRRATLRDQLLDALQKRNNADLMQALHKIPPSVRTFEDYFPQPTFGRPYAGMEAFAEKYEAVCNPLQNLVHFVRHCQWREDSWTHLNAVLEAQPDTFLVYEPRLRTICTVLNTTHEADLKTVAKSLEWNMRFARMQCKTLDDCLAEQPFVSTETILQKCEILLDQGESGAVRDFRDAVKRVRGDRSKAGTGLRDALLHDPVDGRKVKHLSRILYAHSMTSAPFDHLTHGVSPEHIRSMRLSVGAMLGDWEDDDSINPLNVFVLQWVDVQLASALQDADTQ